LGETGDFRCRIRIRWILHSGTDNEVRKLNVFLLLIGDSVGILIATFDL
jgi:hypothetical protein